MLLMNMAAVATATSVVTLSGLVIGLFLGWAGKKFSVEVDEKEAAILEELPGNNCGACGYPGCSGCAAAIAQGQAPIEACPVGGKPVAIKIGAIMGQEASDMQRMIAFVRCSGTCDTTTYEYEYAGAMDCRVMASLPGGGPKGCKYGCHGLGTCVSVCEFDAIHIKDGIAVVDSDKCTACKKCIEACPRNIIHLVPDNQRYLVRCKSLDKGPGVMKVCKVGCIGCQLCVKACKFDAIEFKDNLATIIPEKCKGCGACAAVCPKKVITGYVNKEKKVAV